tara:strand:+ start:33726 stop:34883 length:1158 start_codon:yes stop_codon:yes gene_type:complete
MSNLKTPIAILVAGTYKKSEAYPNVLFRIQSLIEHPHTIVKEINCCFLAKKQKNNNNVRAFNNPFRLFLCHIMVFVRIILHYRAKRLYIPYPSIFLQYSISLLPKILRPDFIILDAFISLYDAIVLDRELIRKESWSAKLIFSIERRAFNTADHVIVDTKNNADYYSSLFNLSLEKFVPIPLATDERVFQPTPYIAEKDSVCRVLFIGTLIPLHGIRTIIAAIDILKEHQNISFHIIGDGQDAAYVSKYASQKSKYFTWNKSWCSSEELALEITRSDICLGIFGSTNKTQRVCPYKIYHYARIGRPIITAKTEWVDSIFINSNEMPFSLVDANDPSQLADQILQLARAPKMRLSLANKSSDFFASQLSVSKSTEKLIRLFENATI